MSRYRRRPWLRLHLPAIFNKMYLKYWLIALAVVLLAIIGLVLLNRPAKLAPQDTSFYAKQQITIGVAPDNQRFASVDAEGNFSGFEVELVRSILEENYPGKNLVFVEIESQFASYLLRSGEIDLAIGMLPKNVLKTQGLSMSSAYYTDGVVAFVPENSDIDSLSGIQGKTLYILATDMVESNVEKALEDQNFSVDTIACSSFPDALEGLSQGRADALLAPRYKMENWSDGLRQLTPSLTEITYHIAGWNENLSSIELMNETLDTMKEDGRLDDLLTHWQIDKSTGVSVASEE